MEAIKNWGLVTVSTGYDASATSIVLETGHGAKLPDPSTDGQFRLVWWNFTDYPNPADDPYAEIDVVTARSTDTLTIVRPAVGNSYHGEGSDNDAQAHNTSGKTYKMALVLTKFIMNELKLLTEGPYQGGMINGKIVTSVSSNNITVAIKTLAGNDPSATDPVWVRIGNTLRKITAALSVTKNAGTNWFNSGSTMLATKEVDYFVYLGYNATDGVVIGFARIPYALKYGDFSTTSTNQNYCAISTITNAASTDVYENVGRFNAVLSATASFNWSIPATSIIISRPIYETRWLSWAPTYGGTGSLTFTSVSTAEARYKVIYDMCSLAINATGTTGGTTSSRVTFTIPFERPGGTSDAGFGAAVIDGGIYVAGFCIPENSTTLGIGRYDGANWGLSSGDSISALPCYRIAS